jgi:hypothetical protein
MKSPLFSIILLFFTILSTDVFSQTEKININVEIDFGKGKELLTKEVSKEQNITALEALQLTTTVETHTVSNFVFVTSINNVKAKQGKTAWYYKVNGKSAKTLAINNKLKDGDVVRWILKEDVCSRTVDKD